MATNGWFALTCCKSMCLLQEGHSPVRHWFINPCGIDASTIFVVKPPTQGSRAIEPPSAGWSVLIPANGKFLQDPHGSWCTSFDTWITISLGKIMFQFFMAALCTAKSHLIPIESLVKIQFFRGKRAFFHGKLHCWSGQFAATPALARRSTGGISRGYNKRRDMFTRAHTHRDWYRWIFGWMDK